LPMARVFAKEEKGPHPRCYASTPPPRAGEGWLRSNRGEGSSCPSPLLGKHPPNSRRTMALPLRRRQRYATSIELSNKAPWGPASRRGGEARPKRVYNRGKEVPMAEVAAAEVRRMAQEALSRGWLNPEQFFELVLRFREAGERIDPEAFFAVLR